VTLSLVVSLRLGIGDNWHNDELINLCSSPSMIRKIKPKRVRLAGLTASKFENRNAYGLFRKARMKAIARK
jgi:hypothetical protein